VIYFFVISSHSTSSTASLFFFFSGTEQLLVAQHPEFVMTWYNKNRLKVPKEYSAFDRLVFLYMFLEQDGQNA
jgi:hypothetical protein